jgi:hypothetical protein
MFGRSKPVIFDPYGGRRSRRRVPRWLVLLASGIAVGAAGVIFVQESYLPPRLSADASTKLRAAFEQADGERTRLKSELADTARRLDAALAEKKTLGDELRGSRQTIDGLRDNLASVVASLPPDPRGGAVQVRAARFSTEGGKLVYDILLSRDRAGGKPLSGVMQLVVVGAAARGRDASIKLTPVAVSLGSFASLRGSLPLPDGFDAREASINVLDRPDGKLLGMRVMRVK